MRPKEVIRLILDCIEEDRIILTLHFRQRMQQRGLFWADVVTTLESAKTMQPDGFDQYGRSRWLVNGVAPDGLPLEIVCAVDVDDPLTVFVTIYWVD